MPVPDSHSVSKTRPKRGLSETSVHDRAQPMRNTPTIRDCVSSSEYVQVHACIKTPVMRPEAYEAQKPEGRGEVEKQAAFHIEIITFRFHQAVLVHLRWEPPIGAAQSCPLD